MSILPRHVDDFSSDPFARPEYASLIGPEVTYNAGLQRVEVNVTGSQLSEPFRVLNSSNATGIVEANINSGVADTDDKMAIRCFGYYFVFWNGKSAAVVENTTDWHQLASSSVGDLTILPGGIQFSGLGSAVTVGPHKFTIIGTNVDVQLLVDDIPWITVPPKDVIGDVIFQGYSGNADFSIEDLRIEADSALPLAPDLIKPAAAGTVNGITGPFIFRAATSRLYIDLSLHAGLLTGLSNVIYDPSGVALAMDEIVTGLESPKNDFYLELPSNVGNIERFVIDEDFRAANNVAAGQTVRMDLDGTGLFAQDLLVSQENDQEYVLEIGEDISLSPKSTHRTLTPSAIFGEPAFVQIINPDADGNLPFVVTIGGISSLFDGVSAVLEYNDGVGTINFPVIIDADLQQIHTILRIGTTQSAIGVDRATSFDLYMSNTPFVGPSLVQGTLIQAFYPIFNLRNFGPDLVGAKGRYARFVLTAAHFNLGGAGDRHIVANEFELIVRNTKTIASDVDGPQFSFAPDSPPGSPFAAWPGGGIVEGSGRIRAFLPAGKELQEGVTNYWRVRAKVDLTD